MNFYESSRKQALTITETQLTNNWVKKKFKKISNDYFVGDIKSDQIVIKSPLMTVHYQNK